MAEMLPWDGSFLRGDSAVLLHVADGVKRPIADELSLFALGGDPSQVRTVPDAILDALDTGPPLTARFPDGSFVKTGDPAVFLVEDGRRRWVPTPETLEHLGCEPTAVQVISEAAMQQISRGPDLPAVRQPWHQRAKSKTRAFFTAVPAIVAALVASAVGIRELAVSFSGGGTEAKICTIRGLLDSGYVNAMLTGRSRKVVAVAAWIQDEKHWYFKPVRHQGQSWSVNDPQHQWEVSQPNDSPAAPFTFAMVARKGKAPRPSENDGRPFIPRDFVVVGDEPTLTRRELLHSGLDNHCK